MEARRHGEEKALEKKPAQKKKHQDPVFLRVSVPEPALSEAEGW
jgi:hypothetical protein